MRSHVRSDRNPLLIACLLIATLATQACGYRPLRSAAAGHDPESAQEDARSRLAVMAIRNDSLEPWVDRILTDALRREMDARGSIDLVNDPANADLILQGRVRPLVVRSRSFSSYAAALEYSVTIALDVEIVRANGVAMPLDSAMLTETEVYLANADVETTRTHKKEALRRLSDLLASRIADSIELMALPVPEEEGEDAQDASSGRKSDREEGA